MRPSRGRGGGLGQSVLERREQLLEIARAVGTPVFVYDGGHITERYRRLDAALAGVRHRIHYSVKANSNGAVLRLLALLGSGADIVSGGELFRCLRAGFAPGDVIFSGVGKTADEMEYALRAGIRHINVESRGELEVLALVAQHLGVRAPVGVRINPALETETHPYTQTSHKGAKFGVPMDEVRDLIAWAGRQPSLAVVSVGVHLGSQIAEAGPYRDALTMLGDLITGLRAVGLDTIESFDIGGGFAIDYGNGREFEPEPLFKEATDLARRLDLEVLTEPGRFIVGGSGCLLTSVLYVKRAGGRDLLVVDAGMNDLVRPSYYDAFHDIRVIETPPGGKAGTYDVVGPICESGDFLGHDRPLGAVAPGAVLAVLGAGAYGFTMGSNYNSRPRPPEVLVSGEKWSLVRRRETFEDLITSELPAMQGQ